MTNITELYAQLCKQLLSQLITPHSHDSVAQLTLAYRALEESQWRYSKRHEPPLNSVRLPTITPSPQKIEAPDSPSRN